MKKSITYKKAGVDINKADRLIRDIKGLVRTTAVKGVVGGIGGFGGLFDPKLTGIKDPLLVASTDGVGTKLKVAQLAGRHDTVGIDLVAMCVNDIVCSGARPAFFLDYFASGKLEGKVWKDVVKGVVKGCRAAGCALLGGETAELPGMYKKGEYDLAGFAVGLVDRKKVIDGKKIKAGDAVLGLASSGLHSNGYSLVRKVVPASQLKKKSGMFLEPTAIYAKPVMGLSGKIKIKGIANITGGGFYDNIPRVLPAGLRAVIRKGSWDIPEVFGALTRRSGLGEKELYRTFNMGIGMVLVVSPKDAVKARAILSKEHGLKSWVIGLVAGGKKGAELV